MNEFDQLYREVILDHYKNPRGHGLLEEVGIPLTPIRLKCALLGLWTLKVALHKGKGTPLPEEAAGLDDVSLN